MAAKRNKYGLKRDIPEPIRREVRRRCGFGCVVCRSIPYDYDHFRVPFADAKEHVAEDIILVCPNHHRKKTHGHYNIDAIQSRIDALSRGSGRPSSYLQELLSPHFRINWPGITLSHNADAIRLNGKVIFQIKREDDPFEPVKVSFTFRSIANQKIIEVVDNRYTFFNEELGEVVMTANRLEVFEIDGSKIMELAFTSHALFVRYIDIVQDGCYVRGEKDYIEVGNARWCQRLEGVMAAQKDYEQFDFIRVDHAGPLTFADNELVKPKCGTIKNISFVLENNPILKQQIKSIIPLR